MTPLTEKAAEPEYFYHMRTSKHEQKPLPVFEQHIIEPVLRLLRQSRSKEATTNPEVPFTIALA